MQVCRISILWLLAGLAYVSWVQAQNCLPGIKWTNCPRRARRCDACLHINFKNAGRDRDIMCMKEQGEGSCIFTGFFVFTEMLRRLPDQRWKSFEPSPRLW